jgi:AcrR family transcriptional regulator
MADTTTASSSSAGVAAGAGAPRVDRAPRADAARNRDKLLDAAAAVFARDGESATLRGIAKEAGVGIGTLFRHFATREDLVEATYISQLDRLCSSASELAAADTSAEAMREWANRFVDYMSTKAGMADALRSAVASGLNTRLHTLERLTDSVAVLLDAGARSGALRSDVDPSDVLSSFGGITLMAGRQAQREQASRMIDLIVAGLVAHPAP